MEAIKSILPLCDEVVVSVGNSEDDTLGLIQSINSPKIRITHSVWDDSLRKDGRVLAVETDKAYAAISADADWAFYIQADEVVHEDGYEAIRNAMIKYKDDTSVEGLLFNYVHFYGSYDYVGDSRTWYQHEIRIVRNDKRIRSYRDAQGFRKDNEKLHVKSVAAAIYHYGWVKDPYLQAKKTTNSLQLYNGENEAAIREKASQELYDYNNIDSLEHFKGVHPQVMLPRISQKNWDFNFDTSRKKFRKVKYAILYWIEKKTGKRLFDYRNYKLIR
ncbi:MULTISPECIES: glycosyltransferase family 2 protein [Chitinophaga]|uniref:glycosyltransferase family 2 protein n=1 Tax=Chitinophaga TaxID=79328 RepID=UPI001CECE31E|nr:MULTISPECIES: glycosyltransferase family 2 protein [Chitinophaga]